MKKQILLEILSILMAAGTAFGQARQATTVRQGSVLPSICQVGDVFILGSSGRYVNTNTTAGTCAWQGQGGASAFGSYSVDSFSGTDDGVRANAACAAAHAHWQATRTPGKVVFASHTYTINTQIVPMSGCWLDSQGGKSGGTTLIAGPALQVTHQRVIYAHGTHASPIQSVRVSNLKIVNTFNNAISSATSTTMTLSTAFLGPSTGRYQYEYTINGVLQTGTVAVTTGSTNVTGSGFTGSWAGSTIAFLPWEYVAGMDGLRMDYCDECEADNNFLTQIAGVGGIIGKDNTDWGVFNNRSYLFADAGFVQLSHYGATGAVFADNEADTSTAQFGGNSFGIGACDWEDVPLAACTHTKVFHNTIKNILYWNALDSHFGDDTVFEDNVVINSHVGLQAGMSGKFPGVDIQRDLKVIHNYFFHGIGAPNGCGIVSHGPVGDPVRDPLYKDNTIYGYGSTPTASGSGQGAICLTGTRGAKIIDNKFPQAYQTPIDLGVANWETAITGNLFGAILGGSSPLAEYAILEEGPAEWLGLIDYNTIELPPTITLAGTATTSGSTVTWNAGDYFIQGSQLAGTVIVLGGVSGTSHTISSISSATSLTTETGAGTNSTPIAFSITITPTQANAPVGFLNATYTAQKAKIGPNNKAKVLNPAGGGLWLVHSTPVNLSARPSSSDRHPLNFEQGDCGYDTGNRCHYRFRAGSSSSTTGVDGVWSFNPSTVATGSVSASALDTLTAAAVSSSAQGLWGSLSDCPGAFVNYCFAPGQHIVVGAFHTKISSSTLGFTAPTTTSFSTSGTIVTLNGSFANYLGVNYFNTYQQVMLSNFHNANCLNNITITLTSSSPTQLVGTGGTCGTLNDRRPDDQGNVVGATGQLTFSPAAPGAITNANITWDTGAVDGPL